MRVFTVHVKADSPDPVLIKEGFSWPAFLFSVFWALWHRLWWVAAGLLAVLVVASAASGALLGSGGAHSAVNLGVSAVIGFMANDIHRRVLERQGWTEDAVVLGRDRDAAEFRYLQHTPPEPEPSAS